MKNLFKVAFQLGSFLLIYTLVSYLISSYVWGGMDTFNDVLSEDLFFASIMMTMIIAVSLFSSSICNNHLIDPYE